MNLSISLRCVLSCPCTLQAFVTGPSAPSHCEAQIGSGVNKVRRRGNQLVRMHGPTADVPAITLLKVQGSNCGKK